MKLYKKVHHSDPLSAHHDYDVYEPVNITKEEINAFTSKGISGGDRRGRKEGVEWTIKKLLT